MRMIKVFVWLILIKSIVSCAPIQKSSEIVSVSSSGQSLSAGHGDTVLDIKISKSLPNAFGGADIFGRKTDAGRVIVQFVGSQGRVAHFVRQNVTIETNETTMTRTPLIIPTMQTTIINGTIGSTPVSGVSSSQSYAVIQPSAAQGYISSSPSIPFNVEEGKSITIEGRNLKVLKVIQNGIEYSIQSML